MIRAKTKNRAPHSKSGLSGSSPGHIAMAPMLILAAFCLLVIVICLVRVAVSL